MNKSFGLCYKLFTLQLKFLWDFQRAISQNIISNKKNIINVSEGKIYDDKKLLKEMMHNHSEFQLFSTLIICIYIDINFHCHIRPVEYLLQSLFGVALTL